MTHGRTHVIEQLKRVVRDAERRGITQYRLAQMAGINRAQLIRLMRGTVAPRIDTAQRIIRAAGFEIVIRRRGKR